jgi:enamine deaminase RidA (YjgF/YER057c/UK114 family)
MREEVIVRKSIGPVFHGGGRMAWGKGAVASGSFVFLSGATARNPETDLCPPTMGEQVLACWDEIKRELEEAGTSIENIVQRVTYVTDMSEWFRHGSLFQARWMRQNCPQLLENEPGSALIGVNALALSDMKVEIQVIAVIPE